MAYSSAYWDACVFNALLGAEEGRVEQCRIVEARAKSGEVVIHTSAATFVECIKIKNHPIKLNRSHEPKIREYFSHRFIRVINCDRQIAERARELIWEFNLQPKDAIHVASAIFAQVDIMHSYDNEDLVKLSGKVGNPGLIICHPGDEEQHFQLKPN